MVQFKSRGYIEMCNFPEQFIDERTELGSTNVAYNDEDDYSPRTLSFAERFELEPGEKLVKTYICALQKRVVLQGRIYITDRRICFYSMLNKNTLFFGEATRVIIPYETIVQVKKSRTMGIFKNAIEVTLNTEKVIRFTSLLKRTKLYHILLELISNYDEIVDVQMKLKKSRNSEILKHTQLITSTSEIYDNSAQTCCDFETDFETDFDNVFENRFEEILRANEEKLENIEEEFNYQNLNSFEQVSEELFNGVNLSTFYNKIYGESKDEDSMTFIHSFCKNNFENTNLKEYNHYPKIDEVSNFYTPSDDNEIIDEIIAKSSELQSSVYEIKYTHALHEFMAPPS